MNRKLKNWVTIFKTIKYGKKGLLTYFNYLNDNTHPNHQKQDHSIIDFGMSWKQIFSNIVSKIEKRDTQNLLNGKGGRRSSKYGQSVTLNIPQQISDKDLKNIADKVIFNFYKQIHKKEKLFKDTKDWKQFKNDYIFYNVHKQNQGSQTQFNFILSEHINDKKLDLSKKQYSYLFKTISNEVLKDFGIDHNQYNIQNKFKENKNTKLYKQNKLDTLLNEVQEQKLQYNFYLDRLKYIETDTDKTLKIYLNRLEKAVIENDNVKIEKLERQIKKRTQKLNIDIADFPHP
ncbi:MAG: hypothetical protein U9R37_06615 [Campylobacterota bacterium]|nr:hypothetical protein [Campylobacterota bacterium]